MHLLEADSAKTRSLLDLEPAAARKRYGRALLQLRRLLSDESLLESES